MRIDREASGTALRRAEPMFVPMVVVEQPAAQATDPVEAAELDLPDGAYLMNFAPASSVLAAAALKALR